MQTNIETVIIKRMTPDDVDGVIEIEQSAYGDHHWSKESFLGEISNELARYYALFTPEGILALAQTQGLTWKELAESLEEEDLEEVVECLENAILKVIPEFDYEADRESPLPWAMHWLYAKNQQVTKADEFVNDIKDELSKLI
jgi:hypothetical protein